MGVAHLMGVLLVEHVGVRVIVVKLLTLIYHRHATLHLLLTGMRLIELRWLHLRHLLHLLLHLRISRELISCNTSSLILCIRQLIWLIWKLLLLLRHVHVLNLLLLVLLIHLRLLLVELWRLVLEDWCSYLVSSWCWLWRELGCWVRWLLLLLVEVVSKCALRTWLL